MAVSAGANPQWWGAAVTSVPLATMALAPWVVKVFTGLIPPIVRPPPHCRPSSFFWRYFFLLLILASDPTSSALIT